MKSLIKKINFKIEISIIFTGAILLVLGCFSLETRDFIGTYLSVYLNDDFISTLASFFSITIAIYITVITILATSVIGISKEVLKKKQEKSLIRVFMFGIIENLLVVGMSIFIPMTLWFCYLLIAIIIVLSIVSLFKFIRLLILIFNANMNMMAKDIDERESEQNLLLSYLEQIKINTKK